jgi:hypothetical protein
MLTAGLAGCGGSGSEDDTSVITPPTPTPTPSIYAGDTRNAVAQGKPGVINLAHSVKTSDGSALYLNAVNPLGNHANCSDVTLNALNFTVKADQLGACVYQYTVMDASNRVTARAISQVAVVGANSQLLAAGTLTPISRVAELGEQITINLVAPAGMTLSEEVTQLGAGSSSVDSSANSITYTAGTNEGDAGVTRLFYSFTDGDSKVSMGTIDVSVSSDTLNTAPLASKFTYVTEADAAANKPNTEVPLGEPITIDLADKVSDVDNDALQLVNVQVFNGMVVSSFPDDMTNLKFEFSASTPGVYYVAYTVSDHKGGYASNLVQIYVAGPWPDVIVQQTGDVFAAPLSLLEVMTADLNFIGIAAEADKPAGNGDKQVPTYDWAAADAICRARGGSLPTETQMQALMTQEGNPFLSGDGSANEMANNWPVARYYFTSSFDVTDKNQVKVWDAVNNQLQLVSSGQNGIDTAYLGYLTCIDKTPTDLEIVVPTNVLRNFPTDLVAEFTTASGNRFEYTKPLYWSVSMPEVDANGFALDAKTGQPIMESDGSATPIVPEFNNNVSIEESTGVMTALADGLVNVSVTDPLGELSDTVTLKVINNLLAIGGADPTFEILGPGDGNCTEEKHTSADVAERAGFKLTAIRAATWSVHMGCNDAAEGSNYISTKFPFGTSSLLMQLMTPIYAMAGDRMQFDVRFRANLNGVFPEFFIIYMPIKGGAITQASQVSLITNWPSSSPGSNPVLIEGVPHSTEWVRIRLWFTVKNSGEQDFYINMGASTQKPMNIQLDDMIMIPAPLN